MATDQDLMRISDLIVSLRDSAVESRRNADLSKLAVQQRDQQLAELEKKLAEEKQAMQDIIAEADALRRGISAYRAVFTKNHPGIDYSYVDDWEASVGSIIWPQKLASTLAWPQQPWHGGEIPPALLNIPGIEWEIERKSCDTPTDAGFIPGVSECRHRPTNLGWEEAYRAAATYLGKRQCLEGFARMEDAQIVESLGMRREGQTTANTCVDYHKAYSGAVQFLRPWNVTETAICRALKTDIGGRREYMQVLFDHPSNRPFRFVDCLGRPISWKLLDPAMPAAGVAQKTTAPGPEAAPEVKPGAEFRPGPRPKWLDKVPGIVWEPAENSYATRPMNATWADVQRAAAVIMGREDCLAGRSRFDATAVYDALGMTHDDRAKTDAAAVAYQRAYSDAVVKLRNDDVSDRARAAAEKRDAVKWFDDLIVNYCFVDRIHHLPISWKLLDPEMENDPVVPMEDPVAASPSKALRIRGGAAALAVLMRIFVDGPSFCPGIDDDVRISALGQDGLICFSPEGNYMITPGGMLRLDEDLKNLRATIFSAPA